MTDMEIYAHAMRDEVRRKGLYEAVAARVDAISEMVEPLSETQRKGAYRALSEILLLINSAAQK